MYPKSIENLITRKGKQKHRRKVDFRTRQRLD
jgi:hypothetical protein